MILKHLFLFLVVSALSVGSAATNPFDIDQATIKMIMAGVESFDNVYLVEQAKKDLKLGHLSIKIIIGPYNIAGVTGMLVNDLPNGYFILIDKDIYQLLTLAERRALVGHEMGHILYTPKIHLYDLDRTGLDICADFFAVKYAGVDAVLSLLEKLYSIPDDNRDQPDYKIRRAVLEEVKRN